MWKLPFLIIGILVATCLSGEQPEKQPHVFVAKVDRVVDGDSLVVVVEKEKVSVRVEGVDAPEPNQAFGPQAKKVLAKALPKDANVVIQDMGKGKYGRVIGIVHNRKFTPESISEYLIRHGYAWHFAKYNNDEELAKAQKLAKSQRRGLWAEVAEPMAPWDYRTKVDRGEVMDLTKAHKPTAAFYRRQEANQLTRWLNIRDDERHDVGCRRADHDQGRPCTSHEGKACKVCGG